MKLDSLKRGLYPITSTALLSSVSSRRDRAIGCHRLSLAMIFTSSNPLLSRVYRSSWESTRRRRERRGERGNERGGWIGREREGRGGREGWESGVREKKEGEGGGSEKGEKGQERGRKGEAG